MILATPATAPRTLDGQCVCGAVHYTVPDAFLYALNCHCQACRRTTGSAFKPFAGIERAKLRLTAGAETIATYGDPDGHDAHCRLCHANLYSVVRNGRFAHIALGSLTDAPTIRPTAHIFVGSKAPWFAITDSLPQYQEHAQSSGPGP